MDAVIDGDIAAVDAFLAAGAVVDVPRQYKVTELAAAASLGHRAIAARLIEAGAAIDHKALWGTPIFCALLGDHLDLAADLYARGAQLAELHGPLLNARCGPVAMAWVCARERPQHLERVLATAIAIQNVDLVALFVKLGADPNGEDAWGRNLLAIAALGRSVAVVEYLLNAGADPNGKNRHGFSVLHHVLTYDDVSEDWCDPAFDPANYNRNAPILRRETVRTLLAHGAVLPWERPA
jgi:ankyrin repeat protein